MLRISVDGLPEDGINRYGNGSGQKLACDLVYMVVVHESWLIKVMLQLLLSFKLLNLP